MKIKIYLLIMTTLLYVQSLSADDILRVVSYNLENLFDYEKDSVSDDGSFTPEGEHQWDKKKYWRKLNNLSRAITAAGEWHTPALIGLCEVENARVVKDLLYHTQLKECHYHFVHKDSPDRRGVDVALAYLPNQFTLLSKEFIHVKIEGEKPTRDILYASGKLINGDTLHVFVNHWPSRYGGELESKWKRITAAEILREKTDSLFTLNEKTKIIIMGDFNDYPDDESLLHGLCAGEPLKNSNKNVIFDQLYNLCYPIHEMGEEGSHKFGGKWGMLDQLIVSGALLHPGESTYTSPEMMNICKESFLLKESATGPSPKRSFLGTFFAYGFSDHLPVFVDLIIRNGE